MFHIVDVVTGADVRTVPVPGALGIRVVLGTESEATELAEDLVGGGDWPMAKRIQLQPGDVVLIPLSKTEAVFGKLLWLFTVEFKGLMMVGVGLDRVFHLDKAPAPRVATWQHVCFTYRRGLDQGVWKVVGHDPTPIPPAATLRRYCGGVFRGGELVRYETKADIKKIPNQSMGGHLASEIGIRRELGMAQPPLPGVAPKLRAKPVARPDARSQKQFWSMIEDAWTSAAPRLADKRPGVGTKVPAKTAAALSTALGELVVPALAQALGELSRTQLIAFDRVLERKLHDIDRADVQRHTDGSDDGFLYARGFVVGMGRPYYNAVNADPSQAITDMEDQAITVLPGRVFEERFDEELPASGLSRETGSNRAGWPPRKTARTKAVAARDRSR